MPYFFYSKGPRITFLICILLIVSNSTFSQEFGQKFGLINTSHFKSTVCPIDENAEAFFLFDFGRSYFIYSSTTVKSTDVEGEKKGFQLKTDRHFAIKITNKKGLSRGNIEIPLYREISQEKLIKIKAVTYNLEGTKIREDKLDKKTIITEEKGENWIIQKIAMPNVKAGSIIEIEYSVLSDYYFNLNNWFFQKDIPVMLSELSVEIPEYFTYNKFQYGIEKIDLAESKSSKKIEITYEDVSTEIDGTYSEKFKSSIDYFEYQFKFKADSLPAFNPPSYIRNPKSYISRVEFELNKTKFPNQYPKFYNNTWETAVKVLYDDLKFKSYLDNTNVYDADIEAIWNQSDDTVTFIENSLKLFQEKFSWNNRKSIIPSNKIEESFIVGQGNVADINLNLIAFFNNAGITSYPVILNTSENGSILPKLSSLNYLLAAAKVNGKFFLLDASNKLTKVDLIPIDCLNGVGRIISPEGSSFINLEGRKKYYEFNRFDIVIDSSFTGSVSKNFKDYAYLEFLSDEKEFQVFNQNVDYLDWKVLRNNDENNIELSSKFNCPKCLLKVDNKLIFNGVIEPLFKDNPFLEGSRKFPIEFDYPLSIQHVYTIAVSDKYKISKIPQEIMKMSPDRSLKLIFSPLQLGNNITINVMFSLSKTTFLPEEYELVKKVFQTLIDKQLEQIVIEKI